MRPLLSASLAAIACAAATPAGAQDTTVICRRVLDMEGRPVAGATVMTPDGNPMGTTDAAGRWQGVAAGATRLVVKSGSHGETTLELAGPTGRCVDVVLAGRPVELDGIVVSASRRPELLAAAPVATEVVTRQEIAATGAADIAAVLTEQTGIVVAPGTPTGVGVMLQGLGAERVLVLVDGQPYIGRLAGNLDLSRIPTASVERVEVVKGPQSTLYGSEAMGGVIQIVTRNPVSGWDAHASVRAGSEERLDASGGLSARTGKLGFIADAGRRSVAVTPGRAREPDGRVRRWDGLGKLRFDEGERGWAELSLMVLDESQRWRSGQTWQFADNLEWNARVSGVWSDGRHRFEPSIYATAFEHHAYGGTSPQPAGTGGDTETQRLLNLSGLYSLAAGAFTVDAGAEGRAERIHSERIRQGKRDRWLNAAFTQLTWTRGNLTLVPGARATRSEVWGTHVAPRLAALFRPQEALAVRASMAGGYRAPDFKETHLEFLHAGQGFAYVVKGNPDLEPETSWSITGGVEWAGARESLRVQVYRNRFRGFIEPQQDADSAGILVFRYANVDEGVTQGVDVDAGLVWRGFRWDAGYSWLRARTQDGTALLGRPAHAARGAMAWTGRFGLRASATALYTGETPVSRSAQGVTSRDSFFRIDARVAQALPGGLEVVVGADNLFDANPARWPGLAERHLYASLGWRATAAR
jgi:outer membrane receptor for ferrienterochelin and colicins